MRRKLPRGVAIGYWRAGDGWPIRRLDWPADERPIGSILFLGGRGDIFEKYLETFDRWHRRKWSVTAIDWRGHGGSGRLTGVSTVGHLDNFTVLLEDLTAFWAEWQDRPGPLVVVGHSMGGHVLLRTMLAGAVAPDAAVLISPMIRIRSPIGARISEWIARWQCRRGDPARPAWRPHDRAAAQTDSDAMLTSDYSRLLDEHWWHEQIPGLRLGPPSWGWLAAAFASSRELAAETSASPLLGAPVLMLAADNDRLTDSRASARLARRSPDITLHRVPRGAGHELLREVDATRDAALAVIDAFLDELFAAPKSPPAGRRNSAR